MARRGSFGKFSGDSAKPRQLNFHLLNYETDHPNGFVIGMPDFPFDCSQCFLFAGKLTRQEFSPPVELLAKNAWTRLP
jgi:hypothetical protein